MGGQGLALAGAMGEARHHVVPREAAMACATASAVIR
jgi:hypothetical protein